MVSPPPPCGSGTSPGGKRRLIRGGGTAARISSGTRPQDPGGGTGGGGSKAHIMACRDEATAWPMAQPTSQQIPMQPETVGVSAVLVDATLRRRDQILSSVLDSVMVVAKGFQPDDWTRLGSGLPRRKGSVMDECAAFAGGVAAVATSPVVFVGDVAVEVMLPTVAGAAPLADFAEVVAADATSLTDAGMVTVGVTELADAGAPSLADTGILFPADPAGVVTVSVADLADAGIPFPATVGVADAGMVTVGN